MNLVHENDVNKLGQEEAHLTNNHEFFPELVWELVLHKIRSPADIESCSNSSPYFWKFLETKRQNKVVTPRVLHQLSCFFHEYEHDSNHDESTSDIEKTSMKDFWKLRETCKHWNITIENFHNSAETGHFEMRPDMENFENEHLRNLADASFDPDELPQRFVQHFEDTHYDPVERKSKKNPFLGRSVHFNDILIARQALAEYHLYFDGMLELITKYGEEIWYVSLMFREVAGTNVTQIYQCLVGFLKRMPNLKVVRVLCKHEDVEGNDDVQAAFAEYRITCMLALIREIIENPIPTMANLQYIWVKDLPIQIFDELLQRNGHVSMLKVERKEHHGDYAIFDQNLPNLNALHLNFCSLEDFEKFETYRFRLPLERFYFEYNGPSELLGWSRLFRALEVHMTQSCIELLIQMPLPETENESVHVFDDTHYDRLKLPNLKKMAVVCDATVALDFLLPAKKSLREIFIKYLNGDEDKFFVKRFDEYQDKQLVELIGYKEKMGESNIWEAFSELKKFGLFRKNEMGGSFCYKRRASSKNKHYFDIERWLYETT